MIPRLYPIAIPASLYSGINRNQDTKETIRIMIPPILGIRIYFVPDRNALQGIEIILIKILGIIIIRIIFPLAKSFPKRFRIVSLKKNNRRQTTKENKKSRKKVFLKIWTIFVFSPWPNNLENSGRKTWINNFGKNIKTLTIDNTAVYIPASE